AGHVDQKAEDLVAPIRRIALEDGLGKLLPSAGSNPLLRRGQPLSRPAVRIVSQNLAPQIERRVLPLSPFELGGAETLQSVEAATVERLGCQLGVAAVAVGDGPILAERLLLPAVLFELKGFVEDLVFGGCARPGDRRRL